MVREIVFDTETTGFNPEEGHRLVEIGAVELINHVPTGAYFHCYINPERDMPEEAYKVHGLSEEFLRQHKKFNEIADEFLEFVGSDANLVAHNAAFDMNFLNYELAKTNRPKLEWGRVVDTLEMARTLFPGARASLDALCRRFNIDASDRTKHGALIDSELLAKVYLELLGGIEPKLIDEKTSKSNKTLFSDGIGKKEYREPRNFPLSEEELKAHEKFLKEKIELEEVW
ncbi:MAG: DNA polymerase III subunit epsilon [Lactobacillaceae bacterium]|jgi:DNA polymerase-3 subunit epsilon|nr:DNA polymerase III subunit epsilon [Lactobacillaceae bacterium]